MAHVDRTNDAVAHGSRIDDSIRGVLRDGIGGELRRLSSARQLDPLRRKLLPVLRSPRLLHLWLADPHRLLRALGIELAGPARERFDARLREQGFEASPDDYDRVLASPEALPSNLRVLAEPAAPPERDDDPELLGPLLTERLDALAAASSTPPARRPPTRPSPPAPPPPAADLPASHAAPIDFNGTTGGWDVVVQLHENFFRGLYDLFFPLQILGDAIDQVVGRESFADVRFTFESWLFVFIRVDLVFDFTRSHFRMEGAEDDTAGVEVRFTATTFSRLLPEDPWDQADEFSGTVTRWGRIAKRATTTLSGQTLERVFVADLAGGWNEIVLDQGPDAGRTGLAGPALDAYFRSEIPELPVTMPVTKVKELNVTWPNSAAFSRWQSPDLSAVTLCFDSNPDSTPPFHEYILHHGKNLALGVGAPLLEKAILDELPNLPMKEGIATVDGFDLEFRPGVIELVASGFVRVLVKVRFEYRAEIFLRMADGELTAELSDSSLRLPAYLWFLAGLFGGLGGVVLLAIGNTLGKSLGDDVAQDRLDVADALGDLLSSELGSARAVLTLDSVGVGAPGLFIRGNATPQPFPQD